MNPKSRDDNADLRSVRINAFPASEIRTLSTIVNYLQK